MIVADSPHLTLLSYIFVHGSITRTSVGEVGVGLSLTAVRGCWGQWWRLRGRGADSGGHLCTRCSRAPRVHRGGEASGCLRQRLSGCGALCGYDRRGGSACGGGGCGANRGASGCSTCGSGCDGCCCSGGWCCCCGCPQSNCIIKQSKRRTFV